MSERIAVITGVSGQDGLYIAEFLLNQNYKVVGTTRDRVRARTVVDSAVELIEWDMLDKVMLSKLIREFRPTEVYNLAGQSSGADMFEDPVRIGDVNGLAVARILEEIKTTDTTIRFCQASSSELFGEPSTSPQTESTTMRPRSPYGAAKLYAHNMIQIYRNRYNIFACSAILYNHESPRRRHGFVTRNVTSGVARIKLGLAAELVLGNLDARRDWGFSGDYMSGLWAMLQAQSPDDYILATGESHSVRDLCRLAFEYVGLDYLDYVREDAATYRPSEAKPLVGDASKAAEKLNWSPQTTFPELVRMMVDSDLALLGQSTKQAF